MNILTQKIVTAPCEDEAVLVAFSRSSGVTLIQCSVPATSEENQSFVFDRNNPDVAPAAIAGTRFIRGEFLVTAARDGVPDRFAAVPLCAARLARVPEQGELVLAEKTPSEADDPPYCYRVIYARIANGGVLLESAQAKGAVAGSEKAARRWAKLRNNLLPYIEEVARTAEH